ncbi:hypothetical protein LCGC14_1670240 [marine sediment metagenome]|uniref:Uncharacterized protein n=1 Tax=marine sediment metagenome TaxID=412755 RepID=A0A0F9HRH3_9ZZZZ
MTSVEPTRASLERTHGIQIPVRADRNKGVDFHKARTYNHRWDDRTGDIIAYLDGVRVPHLGMYLDAGLGEPVFFRNEDDSEVGRFPGSPTSPISLKDHPKFANQGEDYDGGLDAVASDSPVVVQSVIDGAQRVQINRADKVRDVSLLPPDGKIKHPRNFALAREVRRRHAASDAPTIHADHG